MVDGVLLLVDASEGPLPQTRFVLRKTLEADLPVVVVINKVDRADARIAEVVHEVEELFLDLDADVHQIDFPILYANARAGWAAHLARRHRHRPRARCSTPSSSASPPRTSTPTRPLQALVTNLDASPYVGRLAICRVHNGHDAPGRDRGLVPHRRVGASGCKVTELYSSKALERVEIDEAGPGRDRGRGRHRRGAPSARRWPTPTTLGRCRRCWSTSPAWP